jgi:hypothetical protein
MSDRTKGRKVLISRSQAFSALFLLVLFAAFALGTTGAFAGRLTDTSSGLTNSESKVAPTIPDRERHSRPQAVDAFAYFQPGIPGTCAAPSNGGSVVAGCTFVLDLFVNAGTNVAPDGITAGQHYLTYTYQLIQNARVSSIGAGCTLTSTVTGDAGMFDATLQNEICNGPASCVFRGLTVGPGSFAFASGALNNCPEGCEGIFRVAQTGWCASSPGQGRLHWEFTPPAPPTRDSEIVSYLGELVNDPTLYSDYVFNIIGAPTNTPTNTTIPTNTSTSTPVPTDTVTNTAVPTSTATNTAIPTATSTNTAVPTNTNTSVPTNTNTATNTSTNTAVPTTTSTNTSLPTATRTNTLTPAPGVDAFLYLDPEVGAPANGGTVFVGDRFVLDLMLNAGSHNPPDGATAQQSYMTFTYGLLQHARVSSIGTSCTLTSTATGDTTTFDATLQNEVCNGPGSCTFRGLIVGPGSFAFASGALNNCTEGCGGVFRVAQTGWCAAAPGQALLHWEFSPPAPPVRDTEIVSYSGELINNPALFTDYVINIVGLPTNTPLPTNTSTNTAVPTNTVTNTPVPTNTSTDTATPTNTPTDSPTNTPVPTNTPTNTPAPTDTATDTPVPASTSTDTPVALTSTPTDTSVPTDTSTPGPVRDAFLFLDPEPGAPVNGGTVFVGDRFVLDLMLNGGSYAPPNGVTGQQSYMTFTYSLLQNARVSTIDTSCTVTNTITPDQTTFDATLQNEVCNGPSSCTFRGLIVGPGSFAYASGALSNCPEGCEGIFRVAQVGLCAVAPGQARLHWEFSPPSPPTRDTAIVSFNGDLVHNPALFTDYIINIGVATATPTATASPTTPPANTATATPSVTPPVLTNTPTITPSITPSVVVNTPTITLTPTRVRDAFMLLVPEAGGPPNGGAVVVGDRFVLDLMLNAGSYAPPDGATAHQSYMTFTYQLIQNANVANIGTSCVLTNTVTPDTTTFDAVLQNEVCNGPGTCTFRGLTISPGSFAFASGALSNCPEGCGGVFRVAQTGWCAVAPGQARLHWEFSPPSPPTRDTAIVDINGQLIHNRLLFTDYIINIVGGTPTTTPTITITPNVTVTRTPTITSTPTLTITITRTPSITSTLTRTVTPTPSLSVTPTRTFTLTLTPTLSPTRTMTNTNTPSVTSTRTNTATNIPTSTSTTTPTSTTTSTITLTPTATCAPGACNTVTPTATGAPATNTPTNTVTPCPMNFSDVHPADYFYESVRFLYCEGAVSGYSDGTFRPYNNTTRSQLTKIIVLARHWTINVTGGPHFTDVPTSHPFYIYVETAYNHQIITGYDDGTFRPYNDVTRGQITKIVVLAMGWTLTCPTSHFSDVPPSNPFYCYIETAFAHQIITGYDDGTFRPFNNATRGQIAKIVVGAVTQLTARPGSK